jgi:hypothetical protein
MRSILALVFVIVAACSPSLSAGPGKTATFAVD